MCANANVLYPWGAGPPGLLAPFACDHQCTSSIQREKEWYWMNGHECIDQLATSVVLQDFMAASTMTSQSFILMMTRFAT